MQIYCTLTSMPLISHGGAAHLAPANSAESISKADKYAPAFIEVDINCTADDVLVLYHGSASRSLRGIKTRETHTLLKNNCHYLLTFQDLLKIKSKSPYIFDIKIHDPVSIQKIIEALIKQKRRDFAFTSPHETVLASMMSVFPDSLTFQSQPYHHGPIAALEIARKHRFYGVSLNKWWLTPLVYALCRVQGKHVIAYTIDSSVGIWLAQRTFPKAYITTNRPDRYRRIFPNS